MVFDLGAIIRSLAVPDGWMIKGVSGPYRDHPAWHVVFGLYTRHPRGDAWMLVAEHAFSDRWELKTVMAELTRWVSATTGHPGVAVWASARQEARVPPAVLKTLKTRHIELE